MNPHRGAAEAADRQRPAHGIASTGIDGKERRRRAPQPRATMRAAPSGRNRDPPSPRPVARASGERQAFAVAFKGTPASVRIAASSPDWNISRVMSQPPTNSPLT